MSKSVVLKADVHTADELYHFFQMCQQCGADLSTTYIESYVELKGEQIGSANLIEETLSDGSIAYTIGLQS